MKATRRRTRTPDPLASRAAVRTILAQLQTTLGVGSHIICAEFAHILLQPVKLDEKVARDFLHGFLGD